MKLLDFTDYRPELGLLSLVNLVGKVLTNHRHMGRNHHHLKLIYLVKLLSLGEGGAGHPGQLVIHAEVVLDGNSGKGFALLLNRHMLLGLYRLVQPLRVAPSVHQTTGKLIDNNHLSLTTISLHHILLVFLIKFLSAEGIPQVVH
ncbi:hypothetical protein ES703_122570 [subsurface metagenome]